MCGRCYLEFMMNLKNYLINIRSQLQKYALVYIIKFSLRLILWTCRITIRSLNNLPKKDSKEPSIIMLWHNRLTIMPEILTKYAPDLKYCAFISKSKDGDLLDIMTKSYAAGQTLRVPHNARHQALNRMIAQLKKNMEIVIVTPDGPRGPRYEIKPGIILAALEASADIIPITWSASRFWQLMTWDKLIFPKPFSKIYIEIGSPIKLINSADNPSLLKQAMFELDDSACKAITLDNNLWPK